MSFAAKYKAIEPYTSVFGTVVSIGTGIYGVVSATNDQAKWDAMDRKLDQILQNQDLMLRRLKELHAEVEWTQVLGLVGDKLSDIQTWRDTFIHHKAKAKEDPAYGTSQTAQGILGRWVDEVLAKCDDHLAAINRAIMGTAPGYQSLMKVYAEKVRHGDTPHYTALSFFNTLLTLQQQAILCYGNALYYKNRDTMVNIMTALEQYMWRDGKSVFELQAEHSAPFVDSLSRDYQWLPSTYNNEGHDYVAFAISTQHYNDVRGVSDSPSIAKPGHVIVGLELNGNRDYWERGLDSPGSDLLRLTFAQSPFQRGAIERYEENWTTPQSIRNDGLVFKFYGKEALLNLRETTVPEGEVVTGANLYMYNNRLSIQLQSAKLDANRNIDEGTRHWTDAQMGGTREGQDFAVIRKRAKYISRHQIMPRPLAPLRGARLFFHDVGGTGGYFANVALKTGIDEIQKSWQRYDMSSIESILVTTR